LGRFRLPKNQERAQAMHEVTARLEDFIRAINWLLKPSGSAYLLQLAERTGEITDWLSSFKLVVTRLSFIYTEKASIARLVMVEIRRKPRSQTTVEAPLFFADGHVKEFIK
jgi:tRNA1(Val) A37 N6-methylase TrmN6